MIGHVLNGYRIVAAVPEDSVAYTILAHTVEDHADPWVVTHVEIASMPHPPVWFNGSYHRRGEEAVKDFQSRASTALAVIVGVSHFVEVVGEATRGTRWRATFIPEAWVRDEAIEVDAEGERDWTPDPSYLRSHGDYLAFLRRTQGEGTLIDSNDVFKADPAAPEWVREWSGPFTIDLTEEN